MKLILILIALLVTLGCTTVANNNVVKTKSGRIQGDNIGRVIRFLGIPYAQSISGKNRFLPPQPMEPWTDILQAFRYADSSPQETLTPTGDSPVSPAFNTPDYVKPGDNCLALNIWTPEKTDDKLPVMVWLHGGGWTYGSASSAIYDGKNLANRGDVVVVTINHRLGASGLTDFSRIIGGEFVESSNLGIKDIIAALEWVRDNISEFGGNPDLVTIFGESGGGWKVNTMLGIPSAKGLFHRAIVESGPLTRFLSPEEADKLALAVLEELNISVDNAEELNNITFEDVIKAESEVMANIPMTLPGFPSGFWPVIDGKLISEHVYDTKAALSSVDVPLLVGQNGTEFTLFMLGDKVAYSLDNEGLEKRVYEFFDKESAGQILNSYRRNFSDYNPSSLWFRIFSDYAMGTLNSKIMDVRSEEPNSAPVYAYRFEWQTPAFEGKLYSPHTIEIPFVFDNANTDAGIILTGGGKEVEKLAKTVSSAWVEFARTGKPASDELPEWPKYSKETRASMHFDLTSKVAPYIDSDILKIFSNKLQSETGLNP